MTEINYDEYDSPWKDIIEAYFPSFMEFFFTEAYNQINWERNYEFLDNEFQQIVRDAEIGKKQVDKLVKVWLQNGEETWILVHIEIQSQTKTDFAKRMYIYNYRIFDRYEKQVASLAVLADDQPNWRPNHYTYEIFGCQTSLKFPAIKLLDYENQTPQLENNNNPFAIVVLAHLKTQATRRDAEGRLQWKLSLIRQLYERGYSRQDILELFKFIDWVMRLPAELEQRITQQVQRYEEANTMKYVTSIERIAMQKGREEGLEQGRSQGLEQGKIALILRLITRRIGEISPEIEQRIRQLSSPQIEDLGDALLDFTNSTELTHWLDNHSS